MKDQQVKNLITQAIGNLFQADSWLLTNDLSEQSISHKFAEHLQLLFPEYKVDCEYNGNIDDDIHRKKRMHVLKERLQGMGLLKEKDDDDLEKEFSSRAVFPDIIIHRRASNEHNLCIIEVKKSTSPVSHQYDQVKLSCYTSTEFGNTLEYQLGIFVEFFTGTDYLGYNMSYFKDGQKLD